METKEGNLLACACTGSKDSFSAQVGWKVACKFAGDNDLAYHLVMQAVVLPPDMRELGVMPQQLAQFMH